MTRLKKKSFSACRDRIVRWVAAILLSGCALIGAAPALAAVKSSPASLPCQTQQSDEAVRLFVEGRQLVAQGTAESFRSAIEKFKASRQLFKAVGDKHGEAAALTMLGSLHAAFGEHQQALDYFNQSLPMSQAIGDASSEANTLGNIGGIYDNLGEDQKALDYYNRSLALFQKIGDRKGEGAVISNMGKVYDELGEKQKALEYYQRALPLRRETNDREGEAATLVNLGSVYLSQGENPKALEYYDQALPLIRATGDRRLEAITLSNIGHLYYLSGEMPKALSYFDQSIAIHRSLGNRVGEATVLNNIGLVYSSRGEKQKAIEFYQQALPLSREVGDKRTEAIMLNNIGEIYFSTGDGQKALEYYNQSLAQSRAVADRAGEATTLNNLGSLFRRQSEMVKAIDYFNQSLPLLRAVGNRNGEGTVFNNLGEVSQILGESQKALEYYDQALRLRRAVGDRRGEGVTLANIGLVYDHLGEKQKALDFYQQALPIHRAVGDRNGEASTLHDFGSLYQDLGEYQKALEYYNQALPLRRATGDRAGEAVTLNNLGSISSDLGDRQKALDYYRQALALHKAVGDRNGEATTLSNIGYVSSGLGENQKAIDYYNQALALQKTVNDRIGQVTTFINIAYIYSILGEKTKALEFYEQALGLARAVADRRNEALALYNIAATERDRDHRAQARASIEAAIEIVESLRAKIGSQELRAAYFATVQSYYELYIDLLMRMHEQSPTQGFDALALQISERGRARSLLEALIEAGADIREGVDPQLLELERAVSRKLNDKEAVQTKLLGGNHTAEQLAAIKKEIDSLLAQRQEVQTRIRAQSPRYAALVLPQPLSLKEIQAQVLDKDTLLLEYSLGETRSYLWAVTQLGMTSYELPGRAEIEAAARNVYELLNAPNKRVKDESSRHREARIAEANARLPEATSALSQMLLAPVAAQLEKKRLLIVGDGALQYVPFAVLPAPAAQEKGSAKENANRPLSPVSRPPLIVEHEIVSLPSASTIAALRRETGARPLAPKAIAIIADPVFEADDPRLKSRPANSAGAAVPPPAPAAGARRLEQEEVASQMLLNRLRVNRLPFTRQEAERILSLAAGADNKRAFDFEANRATATSAELSQYRFVHFATHGFLNTERPELSAIVLSLVNARGESQPGFLRAHEIYNLRLPAELVVLSACETGLGKEIRGEGLIGLTRGFMYAGARRVVVSLWSVNDQATAELMEKFYRAMLTDKLSPTAALRAAQIEMWKQPQWSAPFYWAAFTLQGEWR
ncbi:MAG: tetratricopeptide repeat protein [Pyrinomonadaceae bacterium]|nr:tetratricopeptide repeat protein [Pyrinomonadaceae bacterium]